MNIIVKMHDRARVIETTRMDLHSGIMLEDDFLDISDYLNQGVGKIVAGLRTRQERGADRRNRAVGDCVSLRSGKRVTLSGDRVPGTGETYLCLSASHHFVSEAYGSGGPGSDGYAFTGSYVLMPDTAPISSGNSFEMYLNTEALPKAKAMPMTNSSTVNSTGLRPMWKLCGPLTVWITRSVGG